MTIYSYRGRAMDDNLEGVYEYLFTNKELLKEGALSAGEARVLRRKIKDLSFLLGEDEHSPKY
ncbi:MAG: hypothetical protein LV473_09330 [Nitrospira sp.]|nr:hypothetical protein [Nitrospira sp.]